MFKKLQITKPHPWHNLKKRHPCKLPDQQVDRLVWENKLWQSHHLIAGLDEAGRGALAGPVVAAAVVFKPYTHIPEINDSKKIPPLKREKLFQVICEKALAFSVGIVSHDIIDQINILKASLLAMKEATESLCVEPDHLLIDGQSGIAVEIPQTLIIGGDGLSQSIGAASIIAKVTRDRLMVDLENQYPNFCFSVHKGYGTQKHKEEIKLFGPLPIHRRSFEPIKSFYSNSIL